MLRWRRRCGRTSTTVLTRTASSASTARAGSWCRRTNLPACVTRGTWGHAVSTLTCWPWWQPTRRSRRSQPCSWWPWWPRCCLSPSASWCTAAACAGAAQVGAASTELPRRNQGGCWGGRPAATPTPVCDRPRRSPRSGPAPPPLCFWGTFPLFAHFPAPGRGRSRNSDFPLAFGFFSLFFFLQDIQFLNPARMGFYFSTQTQTPARFGDKSQLFINNKMNINPRKPPQAGAPNSCSKFNLPS